MSLCMEKQESVILMKRTFLILLLTVFLELGVSCGGGANPVWKPDSSIPIAGPNIQGTADLDQAITGLMKTYNLPGVALAITKDGHLILARAYGYADLEARQQMQPDSLGRIGSIGKTITAVATLHLVEQGKLNLDTPFLDILTQYSLPPNADPRLRTVTVRQIMWHAGGWDTAIGGDPEMESTQIAKALGVPEPTNCGDWIQYMLGKPLDFAPGTKYSYSNFGYCILGRVVEKVSGKKYADYLAQDVLPQMDIHDMQIGHTLESQRLLREVKYYDFPGASRIPSVLPPHDLTPAPYGWAYIEALEGMGGWIGSPIDLMRFINHVDGTQQAFPALRIGRVGMAWESEWTSRREDCIGTTTVVAREPWRC